MLGDFLDTSIGDQVGAIPPEAGMEAGEEAAGAALTVEEIKALASDLLAGKAPETPEEQAIVELLSALGAAPEAPEGPVMEEAVEETPTEDVAEIKLAQQLKQLAPGQLMKLAAECLQYAQSKEN